MVAAAGVKLHPEKYHFVKREVSFLRHKVWAVQEWPTPTDQQQLKNFLGLALYYRWFAQGFSIITSPLN